MDIIEHLDADYNTSENIHIEKSTEEEIQDKSDLKIWESMWWKY